MAIAMCLPLAACSFSDGTSETTEKTVAPTEPVMTPVETPVESTPEETTADSTPGQTPTASSPEITPEQTYPATTPTESFVESTPEESYEVTTPAQTTKNPDALGSYADPDVYKTYDGGSIDVTLMESIGKELISKVAYAGQAGKDYTDEEFYTYNEYLRSQSALNWSPLTWDGDDGSRILGYLTIGLYDVVLNENRDGYAIIPEMAADYPVDVTSEYIGRYGVSNGDTAKAFKISLNRNATWEDGKAITADDYIYSMQQLLHPKMNNKQASAFCEGDSAIVNAKNYMLGESISWDDVGIKKLDDYTMVIILENALSDPDLKLPLGLSALRLVREEVFEASKRFFDANGAELESDGESCVTVTSAYGTTLDAWVSYGPYKLTYYETDARLILDRNDNWYGYSDGKHIGQYQTDRIDCVDCAKLQYSTPMRSFMDGLIEIVEVSSLGRGDADLLTGDRIRYAPLQYTQRITFNTDYEKLLALGNNAQILAVKEFRQAFSMALDRGSIIMEMMDLSLMGEPGLGLFNHSYYYNPFTGEHYRDTEAAKKALCNAYGLEYGEGKKYATVSEAYEALTGYDIEKARELMQKAYDKAVELGVYDGKGLVKLELLVRSADILNNTICEKIRSQLIEACKGTGFEGKINLQIRENIDYYSVMREGKAAMILSMWNGKPYSLFSELSEFYVDASDGTGKQMEYGYDTSIMNVKFNIGGNEITASLKAWADWCAGKEVSDISRILGSFSQYSYETRCDIYSKLEEIYLSGFATTSLYYKATPYLVSEKIETGTDEHFAVVGHGGIRYITYNYNDTDWAEKNGNI